MYWEKISRRSFSPQQLADLSYTVFLAAYPHPAFVLAPGNCSSEEEQCWALSYTNPAFVSLFDDPVGTEPEDFFASIRHPSEKVDLVHWISSDESTLFLEMCHPSGVIPIDITKTRMDDVWVCTTTLHLRKPPSALKRPKIMHGIPSLDTQFCPYEPELPALTNLPISTTRLLESFDWASTPLGPRELWPQSLRTALSVVMNIPYPSCLWWGKEAVALYNDAYIVVTGSKHPRVWGRPVKFVWSEIWHIIEPYVLSAQDGTTIYHEDDRFFLQKLTDAHLPEEFYLSWSHTPVRQEDGTVGGFVSHCFETTEKVIAKRRMNCLREVVTASILTISPSEFADSVLRVLAKEEYSYDYSFAALYFCKTDHAADQNPANVKVTLNLAGKIGIPDGHPSMPDVALAEVDLEESSPIQTSWTRRNGSMAPSWPFSEAIRSQRVIHMDQLDEPLISGFEGRGWGDRPREAVVIPIGLSGQAIPTAVLIVGINTRRPYDTTYKGDIDILRMTLSSSLHATLSREAEVKRAQQLAELDAAKTTFFSNASHELRTPLTLISGPLEDCLRNIGDGPLKQQLKTAHRNASRLKRLVDSLMDFSRLAAKRLEGQFRPMKLGLFTADLASLFQPAVQKSGLVYHVDCDDRPGQPYCFVDPDLWEKIVFNLIGNAFKYTNHGSIAVHLSHTETGALLRVEDTGVGIPGDDISRIFERFHRAQSTSQDHEGTGIGLALTQELVALHGGRLDVESSSDPSGTRGSKFTAIIPFGRDHLPKANVDERTPDSTYRGVHTRGFLEETLLWADRSPIYSGDESPLDLELSGSGERDRLDSSTLFFERSDVILLVDDNSDMRRYVRSLLSRYCTVLEASNGQDGLEMALAKKPNVVLSDVMMPVMDGLTFLAKLRERKETSLIPVILLTAKSGADSQVEGLLSGADDYLVKPFKSVELIARVHLQMQLGKKRIEMEDRFSERMLEIQQLTELSPVAIFRSNDLGKITYVNSRWYEITGCKPADQSGGDCWLRRVHVEDQSRVYEWWKAAFEHPKAGNELNWIDFRWQNGSWCKCQWVPLEGRRVLGALTDISGQKKMEEMQLAHAIVSETAARKRAEEAEERRQEAEARRRGQELLIDVTSHEIRQPVSAILNSSSLVRTNLEALYHQLCSSEKAFCPSPTLLQTIREDINALDAIYQCGLAQERIANDVLSLSRIQLQGLNIKPVDFDLVEETHRIALLFRNEVRMKRIQLDVCFGKSLDQSGIRHVSSDKDRFTQIMTNLLSNAIKFTDTSPTRREISIEVNVGLDPPHSDSCAFPPVCSLKSGSGSVPSTQAYIYVAVTDSGPGIEPEDLELLFQRFQQGSNSHSVFGGSGLGLFVSRKLCDLMGGRIDVASSPGQGATFRFFIQVTTAPPSLVTPVASAVPPKLDTLRAAHVLIAEDNLINQNILNRQLKQAGCTTVLASNGQQAIDKICGSTVAFDAILMDIEMPVLDGVSAVRKIREMEFNGQFLQRHRIYALTANAREGQVEIIRQAGVDDIMIKPYRLEELLTRIRSPL